MELFKKIDFEDKSTWPVLDRAVVYQIYKDCLGHRYEGRFHAENCDGFNSFYVDNDVIATYIDTYWANYYEYQEWVYGNVLEEIRKKSDKKGNEI